MSSIFSYLWGDSVSAPTHEFLARLYEKGKSEDELANNVLAVVVGASVEHAQGTR